MNEQRELFKFILSIVLGGCFWISIAIGLLKLLL